MTANEMVHQQITRSNKIPRKNNLATVNNIKQLPTEKKKILS